MRIGFNVSVAVLGISAVMSQLVVMREVLAVFGGNELTFGIVLGNWTLLTGVGSLIGRKLKKSHDVMAALLLGVGILPVVQLSMLRVTRNVLFIYGEVVDATALFVWSLLLLAPLCLMIGSFFTLACALYSKRTADIGSVYILESAGTVAGGIFFSFIFIYVLNQMQIAFFILFLNVFMSFLLFLFLRSKFWVLTAGVLCLAGVALLSNINGVTLQKVYEDQHLIYEKNTPYGFVVVTERGGEITVFENNTLLFSTGDVVTREEVVHYAMVQRKNVEKVLLIGGGASGTVGEILKYDVDVDYVEIDPEIIAIGKGYADLEGAQLFEMDGRQYVRESTFEYDVVIVDVPDPGSAQLNRFYTKEFFEEVKSILSEDGVLSLGLGSSADYIGLPQRELNSSVYKALKSAFSNVIIIPGNSMFFVASDGELTYDVAERVEEMGITTEYVNRYYLSGTLTEDRIAMVAESVTEEVEANTDFEPVAYFYYIVQWMSQFRTHFWGFLAGLLLFIVVLVAWVAPHPVPFAVMTTGVVGTGLEVVLVLGFQVLYGYVYSQVGILVTCFMLGLVVGALSVSVRRMNVSMRHLIALEIMLCFFSVGLDVVLPYLVKVAFPFVAGTLGVLVGAEFPLAASLYGREVEVTASSLYGVDLLGGCLGALLVSTVFVPFLGIVKVCVLIGGLKVVSGLLLWTRG